MDFLKSIEKSHETFPYVETWSRMPIWLLFCDNMTFSNCTPRIGISGNLIFWTSEIHWSNAVWLGSRFREKAVPGLLSVQGEARLGERGP